MLDKICLGIDPNFDLLPRKYAPVSFAETEEKLSFFCESAIDAAGGMIGWVKFQSAYFEQFGLDGLRVLAKYLKYAKEKELTVILDAKRGDIGSTSEAYAKAYLRPGSDFEADYLTVNPFLGWETVKPFLDLAKRNNKGVFLLVKTSNPDSGEFQNAVNEGITISENLAKKINQYNLELIENGYQNPFVSGENSKYGLIGAVVGATKADEAAKLRSLMPNTLFLCPGFGFQGGDIEMAEKFLNSDGSGAIFPMSRSLTYPPASEIERLGLNQAIRQKILELK